MSSMLYNLLYALLFDVFITSSIHPSGSPTEKQYPQKVTGRTYLKSQSTAWNKHQMTQGYSLRTRNKRAKNKQMSNLILLQENSKSVIALNLKDGRFNFNVLSAGRRGSRDTCHITSIHQATSLLPRPYLPSRSLPCRR